MGLAGCIEYEKDTLGTGATGETSGDPSSEPPTSSVETGATGTTGEGPAAGECNVFDQDCPAGSKCMPVDTDNDGIQDASRCVPLQESPGVPGDDCQVEGGAASGLDDCQAGAICWGTNGEGQGACVEMCTGSLDSPHCPDGLICDISNGGNLVLCLRACDPLAPTCPAGKVCIPGSAGVFLCDTDASGDKGAYGDECEYLNVCDNGLLCVGGNLVPGCPTPGCCTEYCELGAADNLCAGAPKQECVPFYENASDAPPGYEDVGVCAIPM